MAACLAGASTTAPIPIYAPKDDIVQKRAKEIFARDILDTHMRGEGPFALKSPPLNLQKEAWGFKFSADQGCADPGDDQRFCALSLPKPWSDEEIAAMGRILEPLQTPRLADFWRRVRQNGFDTMVRVTFVAHSDPKLGWYRLFYPNSLYDTRQIVISDAHFGLRGKPERSILHLLSHAFDFIRREDGLFSPSLSISPEFLRLTGFTQAREGWTLKAFSPAQRAEYFELFYWKNTEALKAQALKDPEERRQAWANLTKKTEAFARRFHAPTFHSLLNPHEAFAEWVPLVYFDETKARALNPALTEWLKTNVLH